ncbi:MAG: Rne/Rng family ribonuclease [Candidatus Omnitrophica bacterium]|nr:Rne/Rng family ribonuclease [Candidatus Omnitrophota bacterium]
MKKQILINVEAGERRIAILAENKLDDCFVERLDRKEMVGNIYKAVVDSIVPAIGAAFVNYGKPKNGFLYVSDATESLEDYEDEGVVYDTDTSKEKKFLKIEELLKKGQEVMVQVVKEELGTKGARLTTNVSLPGRYLVLMPHGEKIGVSRRIREDQERKRIREILKTFKLPENTGLIARTAAAGCDKKDLIRDFKYLSRQWLFIKANSKRKAAPALLWQELDLASKIIRDILNDNFEKIIVDERIEFKRLLHVINNFSPEFRSKVELYRGEEPIFEKYGIEKELDKVYNRKIFLKCGGYITIEQTEGMVAIDVNTGGYTKKQNPEDTVYKVNLEAAVEVARQLRLRDVGGIVVIDFIDMETEQRRKSLFNTLQYELKKDRAKTHIACFSELNIVELTRQRTHKSLESSAYQSCPYCEGKGLIKSQDTVAILAIRKLSEFLKKSGTRARGNREVEIVLHPDVAAKIRKGKSDYINKLARLFRVKIVVLENTSFHYEDIEIKRV